MRERALKVDAMGVGDRREDSQHRATAPSSVGQALGLGSSNPCRRTQDQVWEYIRDTASPKPVARPQLPLDRLHHGTKPSPGEDQRAGRWEGARRPSAGSLSRTPEAAPTRYLDGPQVVTGSRPPGDRDHIHA